jgi:hypothetical protein
MLRWLCLVELVVAVAAAPVGVPAQAKTLRMAHDADPTSLDPHEQLAAAALRLSHLLFARWCGSARTLRSSGGAPRAGKRLTT